MRYFNAVLGFVLFLLALSFALKNAEPITLRYYLGFSWQAPLALTLLVAFVAGVIVTFAAGIALLISQRRRLTALQHEVETLKKPRDYPAA